MPTIDEVFLEACKNNPNAALDLLTQVNVDVNITNSDKEAPLHFAAAHNHFQLTMKLLELEANPNAQNMFNTTPLHAAVKMGSLDSINLLLLAGASVKLKDADEMTPIYIAKATGNTNLADFIESARQNLKTQLWLAPTRVNHLEQKLAEQTSLITQQQEFIHQQQQITEQLQHQLKEQEKTIQMMKESIASLLQQTPTLSPPKKKRNQNTNHESQFFQAFQTPSEDQPRSETPVSSTSSVRLNEIGAEDKPACF